MVDCGGLRCAQERRSFKKELLSWGKKIPVLIGLEAVALEIGGHDLISELLEPFNRLETTIVSDWEPQETCFYCDSKITYPGSELSEDGISKLPSGFKCTPDLLPYCPQYYTQAAQQDSSQQPLDLSSNGCSLDNVPSPGSAWELDLVTKPHVELKIPHIIMQAGKCKKDSHLQNGKKAYTEEELVNAVFEIRSGKLGTRRAAVLYGIPRSTLRNKIFKMETEQQQKQQQQQQQQQQQSAVPNMEHDCSEDSQHSESANINNNNNNNVQRTCTTSTSSSTATIAATSTPSDSNRLSPYSLLLPPVVMNSLSSSRDFLLHSEDDWEKKLDQIRRKHNLNGASAEVKYEKLPSLVGTTNNHSNNINTNTTTTNTTTNNNNNNSALDTDFKLPLLHELVRKMTEQRLLSEQKSSNTKSPVALEILRQPHEASRHHQRQQRQQQSISNCSSTQTAEPTPSYRLMSLKIPSYRPAKTQNNNTDSTGAVEERPYDSMKIGDALKDIIVKTISEKVYKRKHQGDSFSSTQDENHPGNNNNSNSSSSNNNNNCKTHSSSSSNASSMVASKKMKRSVSLDKKPTESAIDNSKPVKKTRPKRGQYRKYNSQLLMEAVRAVQRGEMSVHRAGSYYGVPHSTLEYKVKERHLLRQKKIKESQLQNEANNNNNNNSNNKNNINNNNTSSEDSNITNPISVGSGVSTAVGAGSSGVGSTVAGSASCTNTGSTSSSSSNSSSSSSGVPKTNISNSSNNSIKTEKSNGNSSSSSSSSNNKSTGKNDCKPLNSVWLQQYGNGLPPQYDASGMNLFSSSFALSTPASELLRKLQHKVQSKSNTFAQDANFLAGALHRPNGMNSLGSSFLFIN